MTREYLAVWLSLSVILPSSVANADQPPPEYERQVNFALTFAHRDLVWLGDPASPTSQVYLKVGAKPLASDVQVRTVHKTRPMPARRYLREARVVAVGPQRIVQAFTSQTERPIGEIDAAGRFHANDFYRSRRDLLPTWPSDPMALRYDESESAMYYELDVPGPVVVETLDFLPLELRDRRGRPVEGPWSILFEPSRPDAPGPATVSLRLPGDGDEAVLATGTVPVFFWREAVRLGSFDNAAGTYLPESAYRAGGGDSPAASATVFVAGTFTPQVQTDGAALTVTSWEEKPPQPVMKIKIDGDFTDWRNVTGVDDPRGDAAPYLEYVPDVDLLEFKVAHDEEHIYLYARVAGQVGRTHPQGGRSYFYAYMDVDQNAETGFLPTRDDDCYFGVDIGDDCEVQFEFVDNVFRKSFYGFCGLGGDQNVLDGVVTLGRSQYGRFDDRGKERENYKAEYIFRAGKTEITEDLKLGSSDAIRLAVSPDGSQVEVSSSFAGFLKDRKGRPTLGIDQTIDIAAGMECDSKAYAGKTRWAADSTKAIRGYRLAP